MQAEMAQIAGDVVCDHLATGRTRCVVLTLSKDENPKTLVMVFVDGATQPTVVLKIGLTPPSAAAVRSEAAALHALAALDSILLGGTAPEALETREVRGGWVLVMTARPGTPMLTDYHRWSHTASPDKVQRDFSVADGWLGQLAQLTTRPVERATWSPRLLDRWREEPDIEAVAASMVMLERELTWPESPEPAARRLLVWQRPSARWGDSPGWWTGRMQWPEGTRCWTERGSPSATPSTSIATPERAAVFVITPASSPAGGVRASGTP